MTSREFELSPFEQAMYLAQLSDPSSTEYSVDCYFDIFGATREDVDLAVAGMVRNHESLHSCYAERGGKAMRVLTDEYPAIQWNTAPSAVEAKERSTRKRTPFSLKTVPVRFTGYELPGNQILLHMDIHHIAFDGRSVMIWQHELFDRLQGNDIPPRPDLSARASYTHAQESGEAFYRELFADGVPAHEMPLAGPRPTTHPGADKELAVSVTEVELARLSAAAKSCGVSTFSFLLAGISIVLGIYCGSEDVTLGFPVDMRNKDERDMSGMFINTAIVRLKPQSHKSLPDYLAEVSQMVRDAAHEKWLPTSELIRNLRISPNRSRNPVFDVGVNYLFTPEACETDDLRVTFSYNLQTLLRDMNITMHRHDGRMDIMVRHASQLFDDALMARFMEQLSHTIRAMANDPKAKIASVKTLPPMQTRAIADQSLATGVLIVDKHGAPAPVGVIGKLVSLESGSKNLCAGPMAKWNDDGTPNVLEESQPDGQAQADSHTLPPSMPQTDPSAPVESVRLHTSLSADMLESFAVQRGATLADLVGAAYGYALSLYAYAEEATFDYLFADTSEILPNRSVSLLKTQLVELPIDDAMTVETLLHHATRLSGQEAVDEVLGIHDATETTMLTLEGQGQAIDCTTLLSSKRAAFITSVGMQEGTLVLQSSYRTDHYCETFATEFLKCLEQILHELPRRDTLGQIDLMYDGAFEPYDLVNQTKVPVEIVSVNKLFERQVALHPHKTAVVAAGERLTFDQLNRLANRAAHGLHALGIGKDSIVGMVLDRTKEIFIAEHAILKAGGAFLPMVPEYPDERIAYCLDDAESPCVITTEAIKAARPELFSEDRAYKTLTVEELVRCDGEENLDLAIDADSLAYCIYTSGSTGKPKGVMIEHRNMCNYLNASPLHPAIFWHTQDIDAALSVTSISFDMSITERFVSLCNGVTLCMATLDEIHNPVALAKLMKEHHTESIVCTPSFLMSLLEIPQACEAIAALKAFHVGGEAFPTTLIARLKELNPHSHVMNGYGPTETSVCCTSSEILPDRPVTIGRPEANVTHYVMDKSLRPVPAGACGELIICGAGVGRGYVKLPEKTAASFFTFHGQPAYHSGDLVRLNADGEYDYYGRLDNQVKLRGLRIELDEIESVINEYPGIKLSKVIVRNNGTEDYLAGYYTAEGEIPADDLRAFLRSRLTPYMVPDAMMQLDAMPLTVNGKIDKKQLPDIRGAIEERAYVAPANAMEKRFCSYFATVLKLERVGATDNFFEIGGTSLSAAMVVSKAMSDDLDVVYKNVFDYPTPRALAEFVSGREGHATRQEEPEVKAPTAEVRISRKYDDVLSQNTAQAFPHLTTEPLGTVLLTGATGFLGIHVLHELLHSSNVDRIVCLVRSSGDIDAANRLTHLLAYYFNSIFDTLMSKKVRIVEGDITDRNLGELLGGEHIDVIINCAALVKHFETGNLIHRINYEGVVNLIDYALQTNARLVQVSTLSIAGFIETSREAETILRETDYDLGQTLTIKYIASKFEAEGAMLDAILHRGLRGKIIRIGNLMGRRDDGEFQINFRTNGFVNRLKAYELIGCFPVSLMDMPVEFSPVDMTAKAVVLLAGTPDSFTVFHANNCHDIHFANVLETFDRCGYHIDVVDDKTFQQRFREALADETKSIVVSSLASYDGNADEALAWTRWDNSYTVKALYRLGFSWPLISPQYLDNLLEMLATLDFFEGEHEQ